MHLLSAGVSVGFLFPLTPLCILDTDQTYNEGIR